jgi:hypothetical protein
MQEMKQKKAKEAFEWQAKLAQEKVKKYQTN